MGQKESRRMKRTKKHFGFRVQFRTASGDFFPMKGTFTKIKSAFEAASKLSCETRIQEKYYTDKLHVIYHKVNR